MAEPVKSLCFECSHFKPELHTIDQFIANCNLGREPMPNKVFCAVYEDKFGRPEPPPVRLTQ